MNSFNLINIESEFILEKTDILTADDLGQKI